MKQSAGEGHGRLGARHVGHLSARLLLLLGGLLAARPAAADLQFNPPRLDFGRQEVGTTSGAQPIAVTNSGPSLVAVRVSTPALGGPNKEEFEVVPSTEAGTCPGGGYQFLQPAAGCRVAVRFRPRSAGPKTASLRFDSSDADAAQEVPLTAEGFLKQARLQISQTADSPTVQPGQVIRYTLSYVNTGPSPASNVVLTDRLPSGVLFLDASEGDTVDGSVVTWKLGQLAVNGTGSRSLRVRVAADTPGGTDLTNTAQITAAEAPAPVTHSLKVRVIATPVLQLTLSADRSIARPGDAILYTLKLSNSGSAPATNVQLFDPVPVGTSFLDASSGAERPAGGVLWKFRTVSPNASAIVTVRFQVLAPAISAGSVVNQARTQSTEIPNPVVSNRAFVIAVAPETNLLDYGQLLSLRGSASLLTGPRLRLTPARTGQAGGAWLTDPMPISGGFATTFDLQITGPGGFVDSIGQRGADGLAFVIQNSSLAALGGSGQDLGYAGIRNSLAIEFDTWWNPDLDDLNGNHVSVHTNGSGPNSANEHFSLPVPGGRPANVPDLKDGAVHHVAISYRQGILSIFIDDRQMILIYINLAATLNLDAGRAWVGFTAATGAAYENHDVLTWQLSSY
jgi:uncharacterized repeat protein (TIGR01451 family)